MWNLAAHVLPTAATGTPTPAEQNPDLVTPGVWGFIAIFAVAIAAILLIMDMVRRIRRVRYRAEVAERLDAEEQEIADLRGGDTGGESHENRP